MTLGWKRGDARIGVGTRRMSETVMGTTAKAKTHAKIPWVGLVLKLGPTFLNEARNAGTLRDTVTTGVPVTPVNKDSCHDQGYTSQQCQEPNAFRASFRTGPRCPKPRTTKTHTHTQYRLVVVFRLFSPTMKCECLFAVFMPSFIHM